MYKPRPFLHTTIAADVWVSVDKQNSRHKLKTTAFCAYHRMHTVCNGSRQSRSRRMRRSEGETSVRSGWRPPMRTKACDDHRGSPFPGSDYTLHPRDEADPFAGARATRTRSRSRLRPHHLISALPTTSNKVISLTPSERCSRGSLTFNAAPPRPPTIGLYRIGLWSRRGRPSSSDSNCYYERLLAFFGHLSEACHLNVLVFGRHSSFIQCSYIYTCTYTSSSIGPWPLLQRELHSLLLNDWSLCYTSNNVSASTNIVNGLSSRRCTETGVQSLRQMPTQEE